MKKKILIFSTPFYPRKSGLGNYVLRLAKLLVKNKHLVTIVCYDTEKTEIYKEKLFGINILRIPCKTVLNSYYYTSKKSFFKKLVELENSDFDLVITNTRFFQTSFFGIKFARKNKIKSVHIEHGSSNVKHSNPIITLGALLFDKSLGKYVISKADEVVSVSKAVKEFVKTNFNKDSVIINNSLDLSHKRSIKLKGKKIVYFGRLISGKGVADLLYAISLLPKDINLDIYGDGPEKENLIKTINKLDLTNRVKLKGQIEQKNLMNILKRYRIFVNPSYSEGLPTSVLEAGSLGLGVIATDVGSTREVINKQTGILIKKGDPNSIKRSILKMINNENETQELGRNLQNLIYNKYNWSIEGKKWLKIVEK